MPTGNILDRIHRLEASARSLEPTGSERAEMNDRVLRFAEMFLRDLASRPAFVADGNTGAGIYDAPLGEDPIAIDRALELFDKNVVAPALNPASGGHMGYIAGGGIYPAALGDYLADVTNTYSGVYYVGPGAVRMEHMLIRWMAGLVGMPDGTAGDLTSGGSIANLIGIVTAREAHALRARHYEQAVVYSTHQAHHSLDKAIRIAGMGDCVRRYVDVDEASRMQPDRLDAAIRSDRAAGLRPWLVIASAGTTNTGAVDPLPAIGDIANAHRLWFHIDGAYGAFFALCEEGRRALAGIERADSLVMDPHKGLFLPYGSGAVLVRDRRPLAEAHHYEASYMQDTKEAPDEYSPANHSPELTRHFRGLRLWLPLKLIGLRPFRACLEEKLMLARYFHGEIQKKDGFEVGPPPDLSVVTYRYVPKRGDANEFNRRLVQEIHRDGRVFLTSMMHGDRFMLRLAALCFRTHLDTVDLALEVLRETAARIEASD